MSNIFITNKITETTQGVFTGKSDSNLGPFTVSTPESIPNDSAKSAAIQYHEVDIDPSHKFFKNFVLNKDRKRIKSKFAKKSVEDEEDSEDPDVDEATGEGSAANDTKYQRITNIHLAKMAENNASRADLKKLSDNLTA